ncbi:MAG: hypothetical protein AAF633_00255 [Chloroflexota bacterium]
MSSQYQSFLIRLQRTSDQSEWRVTLINVHSGEHLQFGSEAALFAYLKLAMGEALEEEVCDGEVADGAMGR